MSKFGGMVRGASGGMSRLAMALGGGDRAEQQGFDASMLNSSRIGQALAQMDAQRANADKDAAQTAIIANRPKLYKQQSALAAGVDMPTLESFMQKFQTGQAPQVPMGPEAPDGSMGVGTAQFGPESSSKIMQALQRMAPIAAGSGDIKADDWAKALSAFGDQDLQGQILSGQRDPKAVSLARRALKGEAAYDSKEYGVTDLFSGKVDDTGGPASRFKDYRTQTTAAQKANVAQSYAAAGASNASRDKTRAEIPAAGQPPKADFKDTTTLRKEFEDRTEVKNFRQAMPVLDAARNAPDTPQGDLQLIYGVGKVLDPNSVVREGEMALVVRSGSPAERIDGFINYLQGGGRLSPKARQRLVTALETRTNEYQKDYDAARRSYDALAKRRGLEPAEIFMNDRAPATAASRTVVRTGTSNGRKVVQYSDGSTEYAD